MQKKNQSATMFFFWRVKLKRKINLIKEQKKEKK